MNKMGGVILFFVVLAIGFFYWYFIMESPCQPMGRCYLNSVNISCISSNDCYSGSIHGTCNLNTFKCVELTIEGDEEYCNKMEGEWVEWGCLN